MAPIEGNIRRLLPFPAAIVITLARENGLLELEDGTQHCDDLQPFLHRQKSQRQPMPSPPARLQLDDI